MPHLTGFDGTAVGQAAFKSSSTPKHQVGYGARADDGREYHYVKAGAVALVVGNTLQQRIEDVDHDDITVRITAAGATDLLVTVGSGGGALTLDEYAGGFAVIDTTPGLGYIYRISNHAVIAASANGTLVLDDEDAVDVALTASSKVTLVNNPYDEVIQCPVTAASGVCVGGCIYAIALSEYGWIQTHGPGAALIDGTPGVGQPVTNVAATAGALAVHSAELPTAAEMMVTGRTGKVLPVFWLR